MIGRVDRGRLRRPVFVFLAAVLVGLGCSGDAPGLPEFQATGFWGRGGSYTVSFFDSGVRGRVYFTVYLPPGWTPEGGETYPLIFFLHGHSDDERGFSRAVPVTQLNQWIGHGFVPSFVLVAPRVSDEAKSGQWFHDENVSLLTSEAPDALRSFCWETFRAGGLSGNISVQGHSRGASGALFFALNHCDSFASAVANAFVSDYVLDDRRASATANRDRIITRGFPLRMTIGSEDPYVVQSDRIGSEALHRHLTTLGITHEYEVVPGATHSFFSLWHHVRPDGLVAGLHELQFHARAWSRRK
ncbi:MAG: hypothetical protein JXP34_26370 [Planctomycetes bacterium]|nr:hypothetical protein [Planctomycetota bacterium]